jgi:hypothetical protein
MDWSHLRHGTALFSEWRDLKVSFERGLGGPKALESVRSLRNGHLTLLLAWMMLSLSEFC